MGFQKYSAKKDPDSVVDYGRNWTDWLGDTDTITTSIWLIQAEDEAIPSLVEDSNGYDATHTSVWLSGGAEGVVYQLTNRITTVESRTEDRTGLLTVEHK